MEDIGDDELGLTLKRIVNGNYRKSCSLVCRQWFRVESLTRSHLKVLEPDLLHQFLPRFPNLLSLEISTPLLDSHLLTVSATCSKLLILNLNAEPEPNGDDYRNTLEEEEEGGITDDGIRAIANGCRDLRKMFLKRRKRISSSGLRGLFEFCPNLTIWTYPV